MGTKVQCKSYSPGYNSMRDINEDSNSGSSWPWSVYYRDKTLPNGQSYNHFSPRTNPEIYSGRDKDIVKQTMLEHEAIFKKQVHELHRIYRIQKGLMDEIKIKELHKHKISTEGSLLSSPVTPQNPFDDSGRVHFPLANVISTGPSIYTANTTLPLSILNGKSDVSEESRLSKVRKRAFDLQLPAEEYIDTEETRRYDDEKHHESSSYPTEKLFYNFQGIELGTNLCLKGGKNLADLNESVQVEETSALVSVDFLGQDEFQSQKISAMPKSLFMGLSKEVSQKLGHECGNGTLRSQVQGQEWMSYMLESGKYKIRQNSTSLPQQLEISNLPAHPPGMFNKFWDPSKLVTINRSNGYFGTNKDMFGLEISERSHKLSSYSHQRTSPLAVSQPRGSITFNQFSNMGNFLSRNVLSREKTGVNLSHNTLAYNLGLGNGVYHLPSLRSKEQPISIGFEHKNKENDNFSHECLMSPGSYKFDNGLGCMDANRNAPLSSSSSNGTTTPQVLPWLTDKPACKNALDLNFFQGDDGNHESNGAEKGKGLNLNFDLNIISSEVYDSVDIDKFPSCGENLVVPIFENPQICGNKYENIESNKTKEGVPDINLASVEVVLEEGMTDSKVDHFRNQIDLNSCLSDVVDLEAPNAEHQILPEESECPDKPSEETLEHVLVESVDEVVKTAADIIVSIDHKQLITPNLLHWFAEVALSCCKDKQSKSSRVGELEMDYFELMTLRLKETDVDKKYPHVMDGPMFKTSGRGRCTRGRQRRDFQRDILPGLVSLSRHEVSEDLQTFGGLMKAMGQSWKCRPTRRYVTRNGRLTISTEAALEETGLSSWGKKTRRPRRQRCAATTLSAQ